ncbi:MAG: tetratricopeptide repeat protein [Deltaproteobacteria bacterium]|jgi:hypothetical protein|nr:tetratricopeptide repeat protein [Deltaproteobacteria bacterium]
MSAPKNVSNPRNHSREKIIRNKKPHAVTGTSARGEPDEVSSVTDTIQKPAVEHVLLHDPKRKEIGVFSAALARQAKEEAGQRAIRKEGGSGVATAVRKLNETGGDGRTGKVDQTGRHTAVPEGRRKKGGQIQRPSQKVGAEENKAVAQRMSGASPEASRDTLAPGLGQHKEHPMGLKKRALKYGLQQWSRICEAVGTCRAKPSSHLAGQPAPSVVSSHHGPADLTAGTLQNQHLHQFIDVRYHNTRLGQVDDITLEELIDSKRITHFYRPSEKSWVNVSADPVRTKAQPNVTVRRRRASDWERTDEEAEKPHGLLSSLFRRHSHRTLPKKKLTAQECFQLGFVKLYTTEDLEGAILAFARSIQVDPVFGRAYVNRALAYERLGNVQQAIEDYSRALLLNPLDERVYYLRGLSFRRLGMDAEALADLQTASDLRYRPAHDFLKLIGISS